MHRLMAGLLLASAVTSAWAAPAAQVPVQAFFSYPKLQDVKISPDGKYLALAVSDDPDGMDDNTLVILSVDDLAKVKAKFSFNHQRSILRFWWANDQRVLISTKSQINSFDSPVPDGMLFAINMDGSEEINLMAPFEGVYGQSYYFEQLVAMPKDTPRKVMIRYHTVFAGDGYIGLCGLNIYSGEIDTCGRSEFFSDSEVLADQEGGVRVDWGVDPFTTHGRFFYTDTPNHGGFIEIKGILDDQDTAYSAIQPLGLLPDGKSVYWLDREPSGTLGLFSMELATQKKTGLFGDPDYDLDTTSSPFEYGHDGGGLIWSFDYAKDPHIVAVETMPGLPAVHVLDAEDPKAKYLAQFYALFPDEHIRFTSNTRDQSKMVIFVSSDKDPGAFYLFDAKANKMSLLFKSKPQIDPAAMSAMQPIEFKARDGLTLHGYLTTPSGVEAKNLPMILVVHDGPHGLRDEWGWDPTVQFFADHGYAVLQVNYRGSGGYGVHFQDAGYLHWGTTMQDDLADGVRWVEQQGIVDAKRVCIYGASYGGYAALENPILYPNLYKCAVGYVGIYDLSLLKNTIDVKWDKTTGRKNDDFIGTDVEQLKRESPVYNADKLKIPVLIAYGGLDERAVPDQAKEMLAAMDKAGLKYPAPIVEAKEGHGFVNPANEYKLYTQMLAFFDQYIGPDAAKSTAATK